MCAIKVVCWGRIQGIKAQVEMGTGGWGKAGELTKTKAVCRGLKETTTL